MQTDHYNEPSLVSSEDGVAGPRASDACARCGATTHATWPRSAYNPCSRRGAMAESLQFYLWKQGPRRPGCSRPALNMPPAARPPCAYAPTKHMPEDRLCLFVGGRRRTAQGHGLPSMSERFTVTAAGRLQRRQALPPGKPARPRHRSSAS